MRRTATQFAVAATSYIGSGEMGSVEMRSDPERRDWISEVIVTPLSTMGYTSVASVFQ